MKDWTVYWQDAVAMVAGILLMLVFAITMDSMTVGSGWLVYVCGGLIAMLAAAGFEDQDPVYSWASAVMAVILVVTAFTFTFSHHQGVIIGALAGGGGLVAVLSAWSASIKKAAKARGLAH